MESSILERRKMKRPVHLFLTLVILTCAGFPLRAQNLAIGAFTNEFALAAAQAAPTGQPPPGAPSDQPQTPMDARDRIYYPGDTERLKPLTKKLIENILLDQKEIWTSPFHMHGQDSLWWLGFGGAT